MNCIASITQEHICVYPLHAHPVWEVMYYISGDGYMKFRNQRIPFTPGTFIAVPPGEVHGSVSRRGFQNISVSWDFGPYFAENRPFSFPDNERGDGRRLAEMIYENQYGDGDFLQALLVAYARFITNGARPLSGVAGAVSGLCQRMQVRFSDPALQPETLLRETGYAPDYIRQQFRKKTGRSPGAFLNDLRMDHAKKLLELYGKNISLQTLAAMCGFSDPVYFSRRFKETAGLSPKKYPAGKRPPEDI